MSKTSDAMIAEALADLQTRLGTDQACCIIAVALVEVGTFRFESVTVVNGEWDLGAIAATDEAVEAALESLEGMVESGGADAVSDATKPRRQ